MLPDYFSLDEEWAITEDGTIDISTEAGCLMGFNVTNEGGII